MSTAVAKSNGKATAVAALPPQFQSFNKHNAVGFAARAHECSIGVATTGGIRLSQKLAEQLKVKKGSGVAFHYDTTQEAWYIERDDANGFSLREDNKGILTFNSTVLQKKITEGLDAESGRMKVSEEPTRVGTSLLYVVLTSSLKETRCRKNNSD